MATTDTLTLGRLKDGSVTFEFQVDRADMVEKLYAEVRFPVERRDASNNLLSSEERSVKKPLQWFVDHGIWSAAQKTAIETIVTALGQGIKTQFPRSRADGTEVLEDLS